jgi:Putative endonuclease segE, GIY-YIG domain
MFGYVYITENLINGRKYIGKHRAKNTDNDGYLGSGTALKNAIKKYGAINFDRRIISIAGSREELDLLEIAVIAEHNAVKNAQFYNLATGGGGNHICSAEQLTKYADQVRLRWKEMTPEKRAEIADRVRQSHLGRPKKPEHCAKISAAKLGISNWTPEAIAKMVEKRKAQIALGIGVPPNGNRGNKDYRHTILNRVAIRAGVAKARERIFSERDTYLTEEGKVITREKLAIYYTPDVRMEHGKLIRDGQARRLAEYKARGIPLPKFHWYHNPNNPKERATFCADDTIPEGWIIGKGKTGTRTVDRSLVIELILMGRRNADIAREIGCSVSSVWQTRHDLKESK